VGKAESTLQQYKDNYSYFVAFLDRRKVKRSINEISRKTIRDYIVYMRDEQVRFEDHKYKANRSKTYSLK